LFPLCHFSSHVNTFLFLHQLKVTPNEIASGHAALEEASGGYGKGQETYCKGVTLSSSSNVNIMSSSQLKKDSIAPEQIDAYLTRVEKLLSEVQTLQTTSKK
jgi:hypothetical protein